MLGFGDLLLKSELAQEQKDWANIIVQCSGDILRMVNDILDFSRVPFRLLTLRKTS